MFQKIYNIKILFAVSSILLLSFASLQAQKISPVKWTFEIKKINNTDYEIMATADINTGWTIYSQFTNDNGPVPTSFTLGSDTVSFEEKSKSTKEYDPLFEVDVIKFKNKAVFTKTIKRTDKTEVNGYVTYMTCDGEKCLPPTDVDFSFKF